MRLILKSYASRLSMGKDWSISISSQLYELKKKEIFIRAASPELNQASRLLLSIMVHPAKASFRSRKSLDQNLKMWRQRRQWRRSRFKMPFVKVKSFWYRLKKMNVEQRGLHSLLSLVWQEDIWY